MRNLIERIVSFISFFFGAIKIKVLIRANDVSTIGPSRSCQHLICWVEHISALSLAEFLRVDLCLLD